MNHQLSPEIKRSVGDGTALVHQRLHGDAFQIHEVHSSLGDATTTNFCAQDEYSLYVYKASLNLSFGNSVFNHTHPILNPR